MCLNVFLVWRCVWSWEWERFLSPSLASQVWWLSQKYSVFFFTYKNYRPNDFLYFVVFFRFNFQDIGIRKIVCVFLWFCLVWVRSDDWFCCFCKFKFCEVECEYDLKSRCNCFTELFVYTLNLFSKWGFWQRLVCIE